MTEQQLFDAAVRSIKFGILSERAHKDYGNHGKKFSEDVGAVGMFCEIKFGLDFRFPVDASLRVNGDDGFDFRTPIGTIDVKGSRRADALIVKASKLTQGGADIYVLCHFHGFTVEPEFVGWQTRDVLLSSPLYDFGNYGAPAHYSVRENLRPMAELRMLLEGAQ